MTSRVDEFTQDMPGRRAARGAAPKNLSGGQRALFVFALVTFGLASFYSAAALLTRVTPALFPGKTLNIPGVQAVLENIPGQLKIEPPDATSVFNRRINLLIIGVDKRPGARDEDAYNTDTLMVATVDPVTGVASLLSFPRDMLIDIHPPDGGVYEDRINASYATGFLNGDHTFEAGASQLEKDIRLNFGIEIDHWVWLDFTGVEKLIDSLGGVNVDIPAELSVPDWWYTDDDRSNPHYVSFGTGVQHLDGYNAVAFGRYRNDSDLYRVKRQQLVLQTALGKVFSGGLLNDPLGLWDAYSSIVHTNVPRARMLGYALLLKDTAGRMNTFSLGDEVNGLPTVYGHTTEMGASVLLWNPDNVKYILSQAFTKATYARSSVEIQNGLGDDGAARSQQLGRYLKYSRGLPIVDVGPDAIPQPQTTITLFDTDKRQMAEDIAKWMGIPGSAIREQTKVSDSQADVVIVIGRDFKLPGS